MFPAHETRQVGWNLLWWVMIGTLVLWIVLAMTAQPALGAERVETPAAPRLFDEVTVEGHQAVVDFRAGRLTDAAARFQHAFGDQVPTRFVPTATGDAAWDLWTVLIAQTTGRLDEAIEGWQAVELPTEMQVWKHVALAAAHLEREQIDEARVDLDLAWMHDGTNPVVHYYTALFNLELAAHAHQWFDALGAPHVELAAYMPRAVPNTIGVYRLLAIGELERAIDRAPALERDEPLRPLAWTATPEICPRVEDLLRALGAVEFEVQAHHMLGDLFLEDGRLELAEHHLDAVATMGRQPVFGYDEIATEYVGQGRHLDAARAYAKAVHFGVQDADDAAHMFQQLRAALHDLRRNGMTTETR